MRRIVAGLTCLGFCLAAHGANLESDAGRQSRLAEPEALTNAKAARLLIEAPEVGEVSLSPDGTAVAYAVAQGSVDANEYVSELRLLALDSDGRARGLAQRLDRRVGVGPVRFGVQWCPSGACLAYFGPSQARADGSSGTDGRLGAGKPSGLLRFDIATKTTSPILLRMEVLDSAGGETPARIERIGGDYRWSPTGRYIAFTAPLPGSARLDPRRGVVQAPDDSFLDPPKVGLFVLDVASSALTLITPTTLSVTHFDWAPDDSTFVIAAAPKGDGQAHHLADIYLVDRTRRALRPLVLQQGMDVCPRFSPDGKRVLFLSQFGIPSWYVPAAALVETSGGPVERVVNSDDPPEMYNGGGSGNVIVWTAHGDGAYFASRHRMEAELFFVDLRAKRLRPVTLVEDFYTDSSFSFSADRRRVAFIRQSFTAPAEVYVQALPSGDAKPVTSMGPLAPWRDLVRVDRKAWPSIDGKFTIHGLLLTPRSSWTANGEAIKTRLPMAVYNAGGPTMVNPRFGHYDGAVAALAARGYAVLVPNTRGRIGYGAAYYRALAESRSYYGLAYVDMMAGVDQLVRDGIADPDRLGVYGHSYGAYVTALGITRTERFKAAVVHEAIGVQMVERAVSIPGTTGDLAALHAFGISNPIDPETQRALISESPLFHLSKMSTPTLLQFGGNSQQQGSARTAGMPLYAALLRLKLPVEFVVYDAGHGTGAPSAAADEVARVGAWFDYWLRDMPYPDAARAKEYDAWRSSRPERSTRHSRTADY